MRACDTWRHIDWCDCIRCVRTTLNLADDVLLAVKERARRDRRSVGDVVSDLVREALTARAPAVAGEGFHGFRPLPRRGRGGV